MLLINVRFKISQKYIFLLVSLHRVKPPSDRTDFRRLTLPVTSHDLVIAVRSIDLLHKWRLNLNNNTWYILSLILMFQEKGIFT